jgi:hypothetical protein
MTSRYRALDIVTASTGLGAAAFMPWNRHLCFEVLSALREHPSCRREPLDHHLGSRLCFPDDIEGHRRSLAPAKPRYNRFPRMLY